MSTPETKNAPPGGTIIVPSFTKAICDEAEHASDAYFLAEHSTPGLLLRIGARSKTWIVRRKLLGTTRKLSIGRYPAMLPDVARKKAARALLNMSDGIHPKADLRTRRDEADAERVTKEWTLEKLWKIYTGEDVEPDQPKVRRDPLADNTLKSMERAWNKLVGTGLLKKPAAQIGVNDILKAYDDMISRTDPKRSHAGGHTQAAQAMRYVRAVLRYGLKEKIPGNLPDPFESIPERQMWKQPGAKTRTVIDKEGGLAKWWKAVEALRGQEDGRAQAQDMIADWLILTLLWGTRSRSELLPLEWKHIDFENRSAIIPKTKTTPREIPYGPYAAKILKKRFEAEDRDKKWIFPATRTGKTDKTHLKEPKKTLEKIIKASGIDFTAHDLRRTFGTLLGETGASFYQTKAAMHQAAGGDVTAKHYMRIRLKALRRVFENLEAAILEEAGVTA